MTDLLTVDAAPTQLPSLVADEDRHSLGAWFHAYWNMEVAGGPETTAAAKRRDLQRFLDFIGRNVRTDHIDDWTKSVTRAYVYWLDTSGNDGRPFAPTSINRFLATLRHCARFIHRIRPFLAGNPFDGVPDLEVDDPEPQGLDSIQWMRIRSAAEQLCKLKTRRQQRPLRNYAILLCLYGTGLRISELLKLDYPDHYRDDFFWDIKRKGKKRTRKLYVPKECRETLEEYITLERGTIGGPLFVTKSGQRIARQHVDRFLKELAAFANAKLPADEHINLHAHALRHTRLRKLAHEKGVHFAHQQSGNIGWQHIWRYVQPTEQEKAETAEESF
ncbi:MAG: tyrosine-type recombinase/integrase [Planctomycetaceae bacterium]|nr:tyrosine-type recombinase/integrase [Planctomycetaceae bacterium]